MLEKEEKKEREREEKGKERERDFLCVVGMGWALVLMI